MCLHVCLCMCVCHLYIIYYPTYGYLGSFYLLLVVNGKAVNMELLVSVREAIDIKN